MYPNRTDFACSLMQAEAGPSGVYQFDNFIMLTQTFADKREGNSGKGDSSGVADSVFSEA